VLDCLQMVNGVCKQLQAACRYVHGLTSCNESSPIMHQTNYFLCVGANGYWWVFCVCVGHQCLFSPAKFFHRLVNLEIENAIFFLNRVSLGIVF
jgi:hypothetical protein